MVRGHFLDVWPPCRHQIFPVSQVHVHQRSIVLPNKCTLNQRVYSEDSHPCMCMTDQRVVSCHLGYSINHKLYSVHIHRVKPALQRLTDHSDIVRPFQSHITESLWQFVGKCKMCGGDGCFSYGQWGPSHKYSFFSHWVALEPTAAHSLFYASLRRVGNLDVLLFVQQMPSKPLRHSKRPFHESEAINFALQSQWGCDWKIHTFFVAKVCAQESKRDFQDLYTSVQRHSSKQGTWAQAAPPEAHLHHMVPPPSQPLGKYDENHLLCPPRICFHNPIGSSIELLITYGLLNPTTTSETWFPSLPYLCNDVYQLRMLDSMCSQLGCTELVF